MKLDLNLREVLKLVKGKRSGSPTYILFSLLYPPPGHVKCKKYNFNGINLIKSLFSLMLPLGWKINTVINIFNISYVRVENEYNYKYI